MDEFTLASYLLAVLAIVFLVMAIPLLLGRGKWLIAGYNTMSPEEKGECDRKYDMDKLCRVMGLMLLLIAAAFIIMAFVDMLIGGIVLVIAIVIPLAVIFIGQRSFLKKG